MSLRRRFGNWLPAAGQHLLKRLYYAWRIRTGTFRSAEPEYQLIRTLLREGDHVLDVGANVGHYTLAFSLLVGACGRVFALEPFPDTFSLLAANVRLFPFENVTLFNLAASDASRLVPMVVPTSDGSPDYYTARISKEGQGKTIFSCALDGLDLPEGIRLVKIDVEGHELSVLRGMTNLLTRDHPHLIVEASSNRVAEFLAQFGYVARRLPGSPNFVFTP
jgi:FkbM family methyltransferase